MPWFNSQSSVWRNVKRPATKQVPASITGKTSTTGVTLNLAAPHLESSPSSQPRKAIVADLGKHILLPGLMFMAALLGNHRAAADQFLLLNYLPGQFPTEAGSSNIMHYVAQKFGAANQASSLKVGVACLYNPGGTSLRRELELMQADLARAESLGLPIMVQVDTENWLPKSLLNWYEPGSTGYDPAKIADVEWYGWNTNTAVKLCWRNWGSEIRIGPAPNVLSRNFQTYEKAVYDAFLPAVRQWYAGLPENKKREFVGWKCGWESTINDNYRFFPKGNSYYGTTNNPVWSKNYQPLGYNAARTSGLKTTGKLTATDHSEIIGQHLTYLAQMAFAAGLPRDKIFVHGTTYATTRQDVNALVNPYANPGVSFYGASTSPLKANAAFVQAVHLAKADYGATGYGYGEFNLFTTKYQTWFSWFTNALHGDPNCLYQALYNYDSMSGHPSVEQAMLDAQALYPADVTLPPPTNSVLKRP